MYGCPYKSHVMAFNDLPRHKIIIHLESSSKSIKSNNDAALIRTITVSCMTHETRVGESEWMKTVSPTDFFASVHCSESTVSNAWLITNLMFSEWRWAIILSNVSQYCLREYYLPQPLL